MKRILLAVMCVLLVLLCACEDSSVTVIPTPMTAATATPEASSGSTATPALTPTPAAEPTQVTIMAVGDVLCLGAQLNAARSGNDYDFDYAFAEIKDVISSADLAICNLETLIAEGHPYTPIASSGASASPTATHRPAASHTPEPSVASEPPASTPASTTEGGTEALTDIVPQHSSVQLWQQILPVGPLVNGPDEFLSAVVGAGFDVMTNGNNHMNDYAEDGIQKTIERMNSYGVYHTGAYAKAEDKAPLIVDVQGIKVGIVAYTDHLNTYEDLNEPLFDLYIEERAVADIAATKAAGAEFTIFFMHWGTENTQEVTQDQRSIARAMADAGADLILGSHPHCVQPFEVLDTDHGSVPVIYSLGNFVSSMARDINKDGVILKFVLQKDNVTGKVALGPMSYIPTMCTSRGDSRFVVLPADAASAAGSSTLEASRERTIGVLGEDIATPE